MAKSYVLTNRKKLDAFMKRGFRIERIEIRVGQLTGKPKYPPGHVGKKSRERTGNRSKISRTELNRRTLIRGYRKQLDNMPKADRKAAVKSLRAMLKKKSISSRGLTTKRGGAVAVARVAGVLESGKTGGRPFHVISLNKRQPQFRKEIDVLRLALIRGSNVAAELVKIGKNSKAAIRAGIRKSGHEDTGRLLRNTQYEITDLKGKIEAKRHEKAIRATRAAARHGRRVARHHTVKPI
jgi:hypothetical protein